MTKYLTQKEISDIIGIIVIPQGFSLMSQDSYNEEQIAQKIAQSKGQQELMMCALNMSIVGFGNQKYGNFRLNEQIINISTIMTKYNVKFNNGKMAVLKDDDLTPQRLCRFFRHSIKDYISSSKTQPYLWRKYSTRDPKFMHICFRGSEYLEELSIDEAFYLLETTKNMDSKLGTNISDRVIRVFEAKKTKFKAMQLM